MSDFEEFCKAWKAQFPGEDLPTVWDEDTSASLQRHKKNLDYLKSEVRKEEFYVTFLEKLLSNAREESVKTCRTSAGPVGEPNNSELPSSSVDSPKKSWKSDFVTVISISNKDNTSEEHSKVSPAKPGAPPKPPKQYLRSVSSESPSKAKPEDIIAWTKQQIQQLHSKQGFKIEESSQGAQTSSSYENVSGNNFKHRGSYENVGKARSSYENVFTGPTLR